jgi:hypothetical protein
MLRAAWQNAKNSARQRGINTNIFNHGLGQALDQLEGLFGRYPRGNDLSQRQQNELMASYQRVYQIAMGYVTVINQGMAQTQDQGWYQLSAGMGVVNGIIRDAFSKRDMLKLRPPQIPTRLG